MAITVNLLIENLCKELDCSQRALAGLLGIEPHSLSYNKDKKINECTGKTVRRLALLYILVIQELYSLRPKIIFELLNMHVFEDLNGNSDSVASALQTDKYSGDTLLNILCIAKEHLNNQNCGAHPELMEIKNFVST